METKYKVVLASLFGACFLANILYIYLEHASFQSIIIASSITMIAGLVILVKIYLLKTGGIKRYRYQDPKTRRYFIIGSVCLCAGLLLNHFCRQDYVIIIAILLFGVSIFFNSRAMMMQKKEKENLVK